ncbi:hypothetical protein Tco_1477131 [Tanacetum coccineum]
MVGNPGIPFWRLLYSYRLNVHSASAFHDYYFIPAISTTVVPPLLAFSFLHESFHVFFVYLHPGRTRLSLLSVDAPGGYRGLTVGGERRLVVCVRVESSGRQGGSSAVGDACRAGRISESTCMLSVMRVVAAWPRVGCPLG